MDYTLLTDELLLKRLQINDSEAFREIYNRYWKRLYLASVAKTHSHEAAEEIVQTLFLSLWERRAILSVDNLESYLLKAVKYKLINYIHSFLVKEKHLLILNRQITSEENSSETLTAIHELSLAIQTAIEKLPAKTKTIFKLSREDNHTVKEIAQHMNLSEKAVEYHITQSLKLMRLHLKEFLVVSLLLCFFF